MTKILNPFAQVAAFNQACGNNPSGPRSELAHLYRKLFAEEVGEVAAAIDKLDAAKSDAELLEAVAELADGLLDVTYIGAGWMHVMGLDAKPLWNEVHGSNMAKVNPETGLVDKRDDGKILKPEGWKPPQLLPIVARQLGYVTRAGKDVAAQVAKKERQAADAAAVLGQSDAFDRLLTFSQVAFMFSTHAGWVRDQIKAGKLVSKELGPKTIRVTESSAKALLASL